VYEHARRRAGLVTSCELGRNPTRTATRRNLELLLPGAYVAATQPIEAEVLVWAVAARGLPTYAFAGATALWLYGQGAAPVRVEVAVPHGTRAALGPHVRVRRVCDDVLAGARTVGGSRLVRIEVAVVQAAEGKPRVEVVGLVAEILRRRRTTVPRLRAACRRGVGGSAAVRAAVDELAGTSLDGAVRRLRSALLRRGVTGLETEVRFVNAGGASCYADLLHRPTMTVVEMDGFTSHTALDRFRADRRRDRWLQAEHGVLTLRVHAGEDVEQVADEVCRVLERRAAEAAA
jgi:hypothetical protein